MNTPTDGFLDRVRKVWGDPKKVANVGIEETFYLGEDHFGFDHDDQVNNAMRIGVLAGRTANEGPEAFLQGFIDLMNED